MRKKRIDYGITDESRSVINGSFAEIAEEFGCVGSYIYGILSNDNPDPFAYFKPFYAACVRAGVPYEAYDDALAAIRNKYRNAHTDVPCDKDYLMGKVGTDAETTKRLIAAFQDGKLDEKEKKQLRRDVEKVRANCDLLETMLDFHASIDEHVDRVNFGGPVSTTIRSMTKEKIAKRRQA